ncbi:GtrA family protein [Legionella dresdenensis]|uniref:GtrA family protein n=1 Tax=Legionella dresdenensis TaxID=450200 RepID=A0ABV8CCK9_9GAMM
MINSLKLKDNRCTVIQFIKYGLIGFVNNLLGYLVFLLMAYKGFSPKIAMTTLYLLGVAVSMVGNWKWTFAYQGNALYTSMRFICAYFLGYLLNLGLLIVFVDRLNYSYALIQAIATIVVAGFLFILFKYFVFPINLKLTGM